MKNIIYLNCNDMQNISEVNYDDGIYGIMVDSYNLKVRLNNEIVALDKFLNGLNAYKKLIILNIIYNTSASDTFDENVDKINSYVSEILKIIQNYSEYNIVISSPNIQVVYFLQSYKFKYIAYFVGEELNFVDVNFYIIPYTKLNINVINQLISLKKSIIFLVFSDIDKQQLLSFIKDNFDIENDAFYIAKC